MFVTRVWCLLYEHVVFVTWACDVCDISVWCLLHERMVFVTKVCGVCYMSI